MGLLRGRRDVTMVRGRALVVPLSTGNVGGAGGDGNFNNFTARSRAKSTTMLKAVEADDGGPVVPDQQRITASLPNWLRFVMYLAGSNDEGADELPAELHVPVLLDAERRTIVELDVDGAIALLEPYRAVGTREWKETEAVLAPVRAAVALPGVAVRGVTGFVADWKDALSSVRENAAKVNRPVPEKELEQMRRTAAMLRHHHERNPAQLAKVREGAVAHGPSMAEGVAAGTYPAHRFDAWVMFQETSGAITPEEAASFRRTAGLS